MYSLLFVITMGVAGYFIGLQRPGIAAPVAFVALAVSIVNLMLLAGQIRYIMATEEDAPLEEDDRAFLKAVSPPPMDAYDYDDFK